MSKQKCEFQLSFSFPIIELVINLEYADIIKPSGISYLLLTLINEFSDSSMSMKDVMDISGVPEDLYGIFIDELNVLKDNLVINITSDVGRIGLSEYSDMPISDFSFTELGRAIFKDEVLPSKAKLHKRITIYYDPASNTYFEAPPGDLKDFKPGVLPEYTDSEEMEKWVNKKKTRFDIKKDQTILKVTLLDKKIRSVERVANVLCDVEKGYTTFGFNQDSLTSYFMEHFDEEYIKGMLVNSRENWEIVNEDIIRKVNDWLPPSKVNELLGKPYRILFSHKMQGRVARMTVPIKVQEFFFVGILDEVHGYSRNLVRSKIAGRNTDVLVPVIADLHVGLSELEPYVVQYLSENDTHEMIDQAIISIDVFQSNSVFESLVSNRVTFDMNSVDYLIRLYGKASASSFAREKITQLAKKMTMSILSKLSLSNAGSSLGLLQKLNAISSQPRSELVNEIAGTIKVRENELLDIYTQMITAGFSSQEILSRFNIVNPLMLFVLHHHDFKGSDELFLRFRKLSNAFYDLNQLLNITSPDEYDLNENFDREKFKILYKQYLDAKKNVDIYKIYSPQQYSEMDKYQSIYDVIMDNLRKENSALVMNPKSITLTLVEHEIEKGNDISVFVYLMKKLESIGILLGVENKPDIIIRTSFQKQLIDKDCKNRLDQFRILRNKAIIHFERTSSNIQYKKQDLLDWMNDIFSLYDRVILEDAELNKMKQKRNSA